MGVKGQPLRRFNIALREPKAPLLGCRKNDDKVDKGRRGGDESTKGLFERQKVTDSFVHCLTWATGIW